MDSIERAIFTAAETDRLGDCRAGDCPDFRGDARENGTVPLGRSAVSEHLDLGNHEVLEKLERLDDAVFDAIAGSEAALEDVKRLWPQLRGELARPLLAESQEHYLRRAVFAWEEGAQGDAPRDPRAAIQLLDVLTTLFG